MTLKTWEEKLTDDYWNYRWHKIMEPLCETFQAWKAGKVSHTEVDKAVDKAYQEKYAINSLLSQRPDRAAALIHWWDPEWFEAWIEKNRPPDDANVQLIAQDT